jgi:hypothetical protein
MNTISASQSISPAIERTKNYLFRPFKWSTYLKLVTVACLTEGGSPGFNFNFSSGSHTSSGVGNLISAAFSLSSGTIALIVIGLLACIALCIYLSYLICRLRFAFFHCLVHQTKEIKPGWRLYRTQGMRYFIVSLIIGLIFLFVLVLAALPFIFGCIRLYQSSLSGGSFNFVSFFLLLLPLFGIIFCLFLVAYVVNAILHDFILPHMALENMRFTEAWAAAWPRIRAEKGSFALYLLLRAILPIAAYIALFIIAIIPILIVAGIVVLLIIGFHLLTESASGAMTSLWLSIEILLGIGGIVLGIVVVFCLGGPIATWIRNYALFFYGGRYQVLGDILSPPPPLPPTPGTFSVSSVSK